MDISAIIITVIIVAMTVMPIVSLQHINSRKIAKTRERFEKTCSEINIKLDLCDAWDGRIIGIDRRNKVVCMSAVTDSIEPDIIRLADFDSCTCQQKTEHNRLHEVCLHISSKNNRSRDIPFFEFGKQVIVDKEIELARKWQKIISEELKKCV